MEVLSITQPSANMTVLSAASESQLVNAAQRGDREAFSQLVRQYEPRILRVAQGITRNVEDAEDVVQDSLARAFVRLNDFRGDSKFYTWLTRITINQALMKLRSRRVRSRELSLDEALESESTPIFHQLEDPSPGPEQLYSKQEMSALLHKAVNQLTPESRIVFQLFEFHEVPAQTIATQLGLNISTVKSRLLRARLKLRQILSSYFSGGGSASGLIGQTSQA